MICTICLCERQKLSHSLSTLGTSHFFKKMRRDSELGLFPCNPADVGNDVIKLLWGLAVARMGRVSSLLWSAGMRHRLCVFLIYLIGFQKPDWVVISSEGNEWASAELSAGQSPFPVRQCLLIGAGSWRKEPMEGLKCPGSAVMGSNAPSSGRIRYYIIY